MLAEEDMTIARWGLAATMVVGFLLASAFLCWLHERDIHPSWLQIAQIAYLNLPDMGLLPKARF